MIATLAPDPRAVNIALAVALVVAAVLIVTAIVMVVAPPVPAGSAIPDRIAVMHHAAAWRPHLPMPHLPQLVRRAAAPRAIEAVPVPEPVEGSAPASRPVQWATAHPLTDALPADTTQVQEWTADDLEDALGVDTEATVLPGLTRHPFRGQVSPDPEDTRWKEHR